jgi:hypothetical protein
MNKRILLQRLASPGVLLVALFLAGCVSDPQKKKPSAPPQPVATSGIQEINVLALPMALNFDAKPGPDGFVIKVYAANPKRPKPLPINEGKIEVFMFDGVPGMTQDATGEARRVWTYTATQLAEYQIKTSIGPAYQFALPWGDAIPKGDRITVAVRYTEPSGHFINSAPSVISVASR